MTSGNLLSRQPLGNGLTLELWDRSRPVAGDRWLVACEARMAIPVEAGTLPPDLQAQAGEIARLLGKELIFSQKAERNFIAAGEVPATLKEMAQRFLDLAPGYFGHPDFPGNFIRKKYRELQQGQGGRQR